MIAPVAAMLHELPALQWLEPAAVLILPMVIAPADLTMAIAIDPVAVLPPVGAAITLVASGNGTQEK